MKCPKCSAPTFVLSTREALGSITRRRHCELCRHRFTTHEAETLNGKSLHSVIGRLKHIGFAPKAIANLLGRSEDLVSARERKDRE